ncbi:hypothetical protein QYS49_36500 [Marivirga salinae]|uniref:Sulfotransferase domain-containing protein n=1 Tax=Marivirga salinarum TaxID=3059078 RepID=A0AA51NC78_9BACT|nr:hypothetical protein [Marivirga sp. BDSF4-3]WMN10916.1 hypothetical protein QYS49_36500 [Marivirga sp. BDSF4-3]
MNNIIYHIGFPKTGTTYLQNRIFPLLNLEYFNLEQSASIFSNLIFADDLEFQQPDLKIQNGNNYLFSHEGLINPLFIYGGINKSKIAKRLYNLSEDNNGTSKVIISIRKQEDLIRSLYCQYLNQGGTFNFDQFIFSNKGSQNLTLFNPDYLNYYNIVKCYQDIFGSENVMVLLQEKFIDNEEDLLKSISDFCNVCILEDIQIRNLQNSSLSRFSYKVLRVSNYFSSSYFIPNGFIPFLKNGHVKKQLKRFDRIFKNKKYQPKVKKSNVSKFEELLNKYKEGNRMLDNIIKEDLLKFKYY